MVASRARWCLLAALVVAGCSVSNPRNGVTAGAGAPIGGPEAASTAQRSATASGPAAPSVGGAAGLDASPAGTGAASSGLTRAGVTSSASTPGGAAPTGPGVTPTSVTIGLSAPFSGTYGALISQVVDAGVGPWVQDVNARGGINGRQVILKKIDNKATSDGAVGACKEAQSNGTLFTVIVATMNSGNIEPECLDKASVPAILTIASLRYASRSSDVKIVNSFADSGPALATFIKNHLNDGGKKLGVIHIAGQQQLTDGYLAEAKSLGMNVAVVKKIEDSQASFTSELLELRNAGVENVALLTGVEVFGILRDAKALNYSPRWVGLGWPIDEYAQAAPELLKGVFALSNEATSDTPAYAEYAALANKYGYPTASRSSMNVYGYALVIGEVLKAAGPNPTRAAIVNAFKAIKGFDSHFIGPVDWSTGAVVGTPAMFPVVCCTSDNKWKGLGPAKARF
jgi:branched-chain amino acid transport system substrate-binding protein